MAREPKGTPLLRTSVTPNRQAQSNSSIKLASILAKQRVGAVDQHRNHRSGGAAALASPEFRFVAGHARNWSSRDLSGALTRLVRVHIHSSAGRGKQRGIAKCVIIDSLWGCSRDPP